jgi:hypothetical protein
MNFKRLFSTPFGRLLISVLLGLGLATIFRQTCTDKNCIVFNGPIIGDIDGKIYKHGEECYKYTSGSVKCDDSKKIVDIVESKDKETFSLGLDHTPYV